MNPTILEPKVLEEMFSYTEYTHQFSPLLLFSKVKYNTGLYCNIWDTEAGA